MDWATVSAIVLSTSLGSFINWFLQHHLYNKFEKGEKRLVEQLKKEMDEAS